MHILFSSCTTFVFSLVTFSRLPFSFHFHLYLINVEVIMIEMIIEAQWVYIYP